MWGTKTIKGYGEYSDVRYPLFPLNPDNYFDAYFRITLILKPKLIHQTCRMSISLRNILAAAPSTERGRPTRLSADPKGERIAYAVSLPFRGESLYTLLISCFIYTRLTVVYTSYKIVW